MLIGNGDIMIHRQIYRDVQIESIKNGKVGASFLGRMQQKKNSGYGERFLEQMIVSKVNYYLFTIPLPTPTFFYLARI